MINYCGILFLAFWAARIILDMLVFQSSCYFSAYYVPVLMIVHAALWVFAYCYPIFALSILLNPGEKTKYKKLLRLTVDFLLTDLFVFLGWKIFGTCIITAIIETECGSNSYDPVFNASPAACYVIAAIWILFAIFMFSLSVVKERRRVRTSKKTLDFYTSSQEFPV